MKNIRSNVGLNYETQFQEISKTSTKLLTVASFLVSAANLCVHASTTSTLFLVISVCNATVIPYILSVIFSPIRCICVQIK